MEEKKCEHCGSVFSRSARLSYKQWKNRKFCSKKCSATKLNIDFDELSRLYIIGKKSSTEIAECMGTSPTHVLRLLKQSGVAIRSLSDGKAISHGKKEVRRKISDSKTGVKLSEVAKEKLRLLKGRNNKNWMGGLTLSSGGYICFTSSECNGDHSGRALHVIIAEWLYERSVGNDENVHHIDGNKLNNNPENLVIMTSSEHGKLHAEDRKKEEKK